MPTPGSGVLNWQLCNAPLWHRAVIWFPGEEGLDSMGHTVVQRKVLLSGLCLSGSSLARAIHAFSPFSHLFLAAKTYCPLLDMLRPTAGLTTHGQKPFHSAEISVLAWYWRKIKWCWGRCRVERQREVWTKSQRAFPEASNPWRNLQSYWWLLSHKSGRSWAG